eukprot:c46865_g1_i1.p1 GENE.c46865_g1_i1~~c46865_g1_i1.p1  ORF type:complete len:579 (+),score=112.69 c46865_g1_i1:108-1739(+)
MARSGSVRPVGMAFALAVRQNLAARTAASVAAPKLPQLPLHCALTSPARVVTVSARWASSAASNKFEEEQREEELETAEKLLVKADPAILKEAQRAEDLLRSGTAVAGVEAEQLVVEALRRFMAAGMAADHPFALDCKHVLARAIQLQGRVYEALPLLIEVANAALAKTPIHSEAALFITKAILSSFALARESPSLNNMDEHAMAFLNTLHAKAIDPASTPSARTAAQALATKIVGDVNRSVHHQALKQGSESKAEKAAAMRLARHNATAALNAFEDATIEKSAARLGMMEALYAYGLSAMANGHSEIALGCIGAVVEERVVFQGPENDEATDATRMFIEAARITKRWELVVPIFRNIVDAFLKMVGPSNVKTLISTLNLANVLAESGELREAEALNRTVIADATSAGVDASDHFMMVAKSSLAFMLRRNGQLEESAALDRELLALGQDEPARSSATFKQIKLSLAMTLVAQGKWDEAEAIHRELVDYWLAKHGADHPQTIVVQAELASLLAKREKGRGKGGVKASASSSIDASSSSPLPLFQ